MTYMSFDIGPTKDINGANLTIPTGAEHITQRLCSY